MVRCNLQWGVRVICTIVLLSQFTAAGNCFNNLAMIHIILPFKSDLDKCGLVLVLVTKVYLSTPISFIFLNGM